MCILDLGSSFLNKINLVLLWAQRSVLECIVYNKYQLRHTRLLYKKLQQSYAQKVSLIQISNKYKNMYFRILVHLELEI